MVWETYLQEYDNYSTLWTDYILYYVLFVCKNCDCLNHVMKCELTVKTQLVYLNPLLSIGIVISFTFLKSMWWKVGKSQSHRNIFFELLSQLQLILRIFFFWQTPTLAKGKVTFYVKTLDIDIFHRQKNKLNSDFSRSVYNSVEHTARFEYWLYYCLPAVWSCARCLTSLCLRVFICEITYAYRLHMKTKWVNTCNMLKLGLVRSMNSINCSCY